MLNGPTVLTVTLAPMRELLQGRDVDFDALARQAGIDHDMLSRPGTRCSSARAQKLWKLAAAASGDPLFGLHVGNVARPGVLHALGLGIVSSTSILSALKRIERYSSIVSTNGRFVLSQPDGFAILETRPNDDSITPTPHALDALVVLLCRMLELCGGPSAIPATVRLPHGNSGVAAAYREMLKCPVEFGARNIAIVFDARIAAQPISSGNAELAAEADRMSARLQEAMTPDSTVAHVRAQLAKATLSGDIDQETIASALHQSRSTLQRRLRKEGTTYQRLLDETRRELALDYLQDARHSLADVTFLLGFADQSNFTRAFKRWTGKTPRQYVSSPTHS